MPRRRRSGGQEEGSSQVAPLLQIRDPSLYRILAHPLRLRILVLFQQDEPLSVKGMADRLGEPHARVHYHVRQLVKGGFLREVGQREVNGIMERFYFPTAEYFEVAEPVEALPALAGVRGRVVKGILDQVNALVRKVVEEKEPYGLGAAFKEAYVPPEDINKVLSRMAKVLDRFKQPRPGTVPVSFVMLAVPSKRGPAGPDRGL